MTTTAWTCPSCKTSVSTPFCAQCGERPILPQDFTLRGVFDRLLHALTSIDGRVLRTFWRLLRHPGTLTVAYMQGVRKPYASPFQLFLLANVLFFAVQSFTRINIFGSSLESHLLHQDWSPLASSLLQRHLEKTHNTLALYEPIFNRAVVLNAKSLVILMALPFTIVLGLLEFRSRRPLMNHLAFSLHLYAFLMLLFSFAVLLARVHMWTGGAGLDSPRVDNVLSVFNFAAGVAYLYAALGPAYGTRGPARFVKALVLAITVAAIVLGYRFALFLITLYAA